MAKLVLSIILIFIFPGIFSCTSPQKLFDKGNYEKAVYSSVNDLQKNPGSNAAKQLLIRAYHEASSQFLAEIESANNSNSAAKPDILYNNYLSLQKLYNAIIAVPAARDAVYPTDYAAEVRSTSLEAAEFRYARGMELLNGGGRENAKKAHEDFKMADLYVPGYKDVSAQKKLALELGTTNVVINNIRQQFGFYSVNGSFLEQDILWELRSIGKDNFYAFYTISDAQFKGIRVDQVMDLFLYDIWFGTLSSSQYSYNVSKQISQPGPKPSDPPVKITVSATVFVTRQVIDSRAVMDCNITDGITRRFIYSQRFPAHYTWENLSGTYTGDGRALSSRDNAIVNGAYNNPPSYDDLYRHLTREIIRDLNSRMRELYGK